jgi:apolipoprotein D and lipocalin family protein
MTCHPLTLPRLAAFLRSAFAIAAAVIVSACASTNTHPMKKPSTPLHTVRYVDLPRFMGDWRVIANIPYFAEKGCVDSIESYALRPDGKIENWFTYRKKSFDAPQKTIKAQAVVVNKETNAEWRVKFFGLIAANYLVIDLDPNYQWTVIGHPSRNYGWIMAREKTLPPATYEMLLDRLAAQGYDPARFAKVPQSPGPLPAAR